MVETENAKKLKTTFEIPNASNNLASLHLHQHDRSAVVEFIDNGCGMDEAFIEKELFRPFRSTKTSGFGLGAYQCREYVRELGGDLEIISSPGSGTTVRVILPAADLQAGEDKSQAVTG